ncbi:MAG: Helix-turn-helix domain [Eubacteriaceae bacterium]|jgi:excisionase family DNA binding protein|nr:Helix-turn-helix domain [Eubacteriaceae bacterium]MDK2904626.1 Helix-turn-helix domain [Eubacteriaceae bacterium]MDK2935354.1 Helix-turn-helix domain [Eubacteriaceae bacterium]MDK2962056.1 Helix-turn-helix domain [Eubacteriaceae bacterium]
MSEEKLVLRTKEVAALLDISVPKVVELAHRADFPAVWIGKAIRVPKKELEEWLSREARGENVP